MRNLSVSGVCLGLCLSAGIAGAGVVYGQVDTFDSSTMDWSSTFGTPTTNWVSGGGPGGVGDAYMKVQTNGASSGSGSRLGAWNDDQWSGDYLGQGVTKIQMDIAGFTGPGAELRLVFLSNTGSQYTSLDSQFVPTDGVWRTYTFDISEDALLFLSGVLGYDDSFADMGRMQLRHQPGDPAGFGGAPAYNGSIGVDNIRAVPGAGVLPGVMGGLVLSVRRRRRAR